MIKYGWWHVNWDITLEGETVRFKDLDECSQEHILDRIKEGFTGGEVVMECDDDSDDTDELEEE